MDKRTGYYAQFELSAILVGAQSSVSREFSENHVHDRHGLFTVTNRQHTRTFLQQGHHCRF